MKPLVLTLTMSMHALSVTHGSYPKFLVSSEADVSVYHSTKQPSYDVVEIVYQDCTTKFMVRRDDMGQLRDTSLTEMVTKSIDRANNGCK